MKNGKNLPQLHLHLDFVGQGRKRRRQKRFYRCKLHKRGRQIFEQNNILPLRSASDDRLLCWGFALSQCPSTRYPPRDVRHTPRHSKRTGFSSRIERNRGFQTQSRRQGYRRKMQWIHFVCAWTSRRQSQRMLPQRRMFALQSQTCFGQSVYAKRRAPSPRRRDVRIYPLLQSISYRRCGNRTLKTTEFLFEWW